MPTQQSRTLCALSLVAALTSAGTAFAAGSHTGGHGYDDTATFGRPGTAAEATRTVEIVMSDNYFEPERLSLQEGETVRFVIRNEGDFLHEFNLGTAAMHASHQEQMSTMMEHGMLTPISIDHEKMKMDHGGGAMHHVDPNAVLVEPGKTAELVWTFTDATDLEFACNIPGHYDAGMVGEIELLTSSGTGN